MTVNRPAEWAEMFDDGWRTMKYRFYDPKMHGVDWDAARAKYRPLVDFVGDRQEVLNILNEMIGELNASHTGAAPPPRGQGGGGVSTSHLGIELEPDNAAGRYRVTHVYEDGPADKDWVRVKAGDYLLAIDGPDRRRAWTGAIDLHYVPYYGSRDTPGIVGGPKKAGTSFFHCDATCALIHRRRRYTVGLLAVRKGQKPHEQVKALLAQVAARGLSIGGVVPDAGFDSGETILLVQEAELIPNFADSLC